MDQTGVDPTELAKEKLRESLAKALQGRTDLTQALPKTVDTSTLTKSVSTVKKRKREKSPPNPASSPAPTSSTTPAPVEDEEARKKRLRAERFKPDLERQAAENRRKETEQRDAFVPFDRARTVGVVCGGAYRKHLGEVPYSDLAGGRDCEDFIEATVARATSAHVNYSTTNGSYEIDLRTYLTATGDPLGFLTRFSRQRQTIACSIEGGRIKVYHLGPFG